MRVATVIAIVVQAGLAAATQQPRFASSTSLVRLEVSVLDDRGAVRELKPAEFVVEDSGVRQVVQVEEAADTPLDLVLVAQPMDSVAYTAVEQTSRVAAGLSAFLDQIQSRDRLGAFSAGAPPRRLPTGIRKTVLRRQSFRKWRVRCTIRCHRGSVKRICSF